MTVFVSSSFGSCSSRPDGVAFGRGDLADVVLIDARHDAQQRGLARAVETEHADLGAVIEAERDVAQDHFVAGWDETSHFVHGVDYEGFVCHSGVYQLFYHEGHKGARRKEKKKSVVE